MSYQIKIIDYIVLFLTIITYVFIGAYFGCFGSKQKSAKEYMFGKRNLNAIPIGLSIFSSSVSAISILGTPSEIYVFGIQFAIHIIGAYLSVILTWMFILPVFNGTQKFKSPYEYYEHRFNRTVRIVSSVIYIINALFIVPIVIYSCCLPISEATGVNVIICSIILGGICILYTMIGGFQTVIWTDVLQTILMFITLSCIFIVSVIKAGGFQEIWKNAENGGRLHFFDFDLNPFKRLTFWCMVIGTMIDYTSYQGSTATSLQRYLSVKTEKEGRLSIFIATSGYAFITILGSIIGLCIYTTYQGCDPVANKELKNYNQLTPHFALETIQNIPGFSGIFIAGLLSAGLSSMAAELNTISGIIYYDCFQNKHKNPSSDVKGAAIMKLIVLIFGIICISLVSVMQRIKYLIPATVMFIGTGYGLKLGLIILGTTFPKSNAKGALCGMLIAGIFMSWIAINAFINDVGSSEALPISIENCTLTNQSIINETEYYTTITPSILEPLNTTTKPEPFFLYKLSFLYYTLFGSCITIVVALIVSYATGVNDFEKMDPKLFIPCRRPNITVKNKEEELQCILKNKETTNVL